MPLSEQEQRCVELTCKYLNGAEGGVWRVEEGASLDDQFRDRPSPEVIVTNGEKTAAVEVKRLTGDRAWNEYVESHLSLRRYLLPSCGGSYRLVPCVDLRLPLGRKVKKSLKAEIERVAGTLLPGQPAGVKIRREATIKVANASGSPLVFCSHNLTGEFVRACSAHVLGSFWLDDTDQWEHRFVTEAAKEDFCQAVASACTAALASSAGMAPVHWYEEWKLTRQESDREGVWIVAATEAADLPTSVASAVEGMLEKGIEKFWRHWGDMHLLVFETDGLIAQRELAEETLQGFEPQEPAALDRVLWVEGSEIGVIWSREGASAS